MTQNSKSALSDVDARITLAGWDEHLIDLVHSVATFEPGSQLYRAYLALPEMAITRDELINVYLAFQSALGYKVQVDGPPEAFGPDPVHLNQQLCANFFGGAIHDREQA